ncbi:MAG: acyltransferase family protein [Candidatus Korobacteraceae bacterium]
MKLSDLPNARYLPALDGLRAIAVLVVITYHAGFTAVPGDLGVSVFFVLSGFLITWLLLKEEAQNGEISLGNFYIRRTLRIFPAYFAFLAVSYAFDALRGFQWPGGLTWASLTYTVNYYNALHNHPPTAVAHAWSLSIEEQFYLLWPLVFIFTPSRARAWMLAASITLVAGWRSLLYLHFDVGSAYVYNALDTRFDNLAVGCLLAILCLQPRFQELLENRSAWIPLAPVVFLLVSRTMTSPEYHYSVGFTVDALLIAVFLAQIIQRPWAWLDFKSVKWLGTLSYPMYLYHIWGLGAAHKLVESSVPALLIGTAITTALASASYYFIERPVLSLKSRIQQVSSGRRTLSPVRTFNGD